MCAYATARTGGARLMHIKREMAELTEKTAATTKEVRRNIDANQLSRQAIFAIVVSGFDTVAARATLWW